MWDFSPFVLLSHDFVIHNPNFKVVEFDHFRIQAGLPSFVISASPLHKQALSMQRRLMF